MYFVFANPGAVARRIRVRIPKELEAVYVNPKASTPLQCNCFGTDSCAWDFLSQRPPAPCNQKVCMVYLNVRTRSAGAMFLQWLSGSAKAEEALLARVAKLQKDSREWPRVLADFLELVPEGHRLRCKDRRVLEVVLSLCNSELNSQGNVDADRVILLLRATQRLLGARGLYSLLPKYSLQCFMQVFMPRPQADSSTRAAAPPIYAQPAIFAALLRLFLGLVEPASESTDDEKAERSNKVHFDSNSGVDCLAALIESFGCGPRQFLHVEVACLALRLVESLLLTRARTTDYGLTTSITAQLAAPVKARVLLHLVRHPRAELRARAGALLQAVLLECEPAQ